MLSYNQIIKLNQEFADAHKVIQTFGNGEPFKKTDHDQIPTYKYPLMWMEDTTNPVQQKQYGYSFIVSFLTRVETPKDREDALIFHEYAKAKSDMIQCLQDLVAYWVQDTNYPSMGIDTNISVETLEDVTPDRLTGCQATITWYENFNYDSCIIPLDGITPPPSVDCEDVTITINGNSTVDTPSGGTKVMTIQTASGDPVTITTVTNTFNSYLGTIPDYPVTPSVRFYRPAYIQRFSVASYDEGWQWLNNADTYNDNIGATDIIQRLDPDDWGKIVHDDSATTGISEHLFRFVGVNGGYFNLSTSTWFDRDGNASDWATETAKDGDNYIVDRWTGIGWIAGEFQPLNTWANQLSTAYTTSKAGYNQFFIPTKSQAVTIMYNQINGWHTAQLANRCFQWGLGVGSALNVQTCSIRQTTASQMYGVIWVTETIFNQSTAINYYGNLMRYHTEWE